MKFISKQSLASGTLMSVFFNAGAKIIQVLSMFLVGNLFGTGVDTDLYYFLYNFVIVIIAGFMGGIDATVVMPEFIRLRQQEGDGPAMGFVNKYIFIYLAIALVFTFYGFINPISFYDIFSNFKGTVLTDHRSMLLISLVLLVLVLVTNLLANVLNSYKYFAITNGFLLFNNLLALVSLLLFYKKYGIMSVMAGVTVGYMFNLIFLVFLLRVKFKWNFFIINRSISKRLIKFAGANQLVAFIVAIRSYCIQFLLSGLNAGVLTTVNWGNQIASLADAFLNVQFYSITGVRFSEYLALKQPEKAERFFYTVFNLLFLIAVIVFLLLFICSGSIVTIFNFKKAISSEIAEVLSNSMVYLSLVPLVNIITFLFSRLLVSFQLLNRIFLIYSIIGQVALLLLIWGGIYWYGYMGYIVASVIGFLIVAVFNYLLVKKHFKGVTVKKIFSTIYRTLIMGAIVMAAGILLKRSVGVYAVSYPIPAIIIVVTVVALLFFTQIKKSLLAFNKEVF